MQGVHGEPDRSLVGDLRDGVDPEPADDGVRDCAHAVYHHQLVHLVTFLSIVKEMPLLPKVKMLCRCC